MLRFALKSILFLVCLFSLLLGGVVIAAGGLQATRFLLIQAPDKTLTAVFENGQVERLTRPAEAVEQVEIYGNRLRWINQNHELVLWENGSRQVLSRTISDSYVVDYRPNPATFVWAEHETDTETFSLRFWNGEQSVTVESGIREAIQLTWLSDGRLWWLELASDDRWQVMQWDGRKTTRLMADLNRIYDLQFLSCGAFWFHQADNAPNQLVIWNGQLHTLDLPGPVRGLRSHDCQTFLLLSETVWNSGQDQHYLWSGDLVQLIPAPMGYLIDDRLLLTIVPSDKPDGQWRMTLWRDEQFWASVALPFGKGTPIFAPPVLHTRTLMMFAIEETYPNGDLYAWDLGFGQLQTLTSPQTRSFLTGGTPFQWFGDDETGGVAWCSRDPRTRENTIYAWKPGRKAVTLVQSHADCMLRAMNDGSLVGVTQPNGTQPSGYYRWDNDQTVIFAYKPEYLTTVTEFSDWVVWE